MEKLGQLIVRDNHTIHIFFKTCFIIDETGFFIINYPVQFSILKTISLGIFLIFLLI